MERKRKKITAFGVANTFIMVLLVLCFIIPFWIILVASLSDNQRLQIEGLSLGFKGFSFAGYKFLFSMSDMFLRSIGVSLFTAFVSSFLSVFVCTFAGYVLSRPYLVGRKFFNVFLVVTMFFSGGTIPTFLVIRAIGIYDTVWALILPGVSSAYSIMLIRNYLYGIPAALEEAAQLDGANDFQLLFKVFIPLSLPIMFTVWLTAFIAKWNAWLPSLLYLGATNSKLWTAQYVLRQILTDMQSLFGSTSSGSISTAPLIAAKNAGIVIVVLPLILISPIVQKYFVGGVTAGSVKG